MLAASHSENASPGIAVMGNGQAAETEHSRTPQPIRHAVDAYASQVQAVHKDKRTTADQTTAQTESAKAPIQAVLKDKPAPADTTTAQSVQARAPIKAVLKDRQSNPQVRPWLKIRMPAGAFDVEQIAAEWRAEHQEAHRGADAMRLYNALIVHGDLAGALKVCPTLGLVLSSPKNQKKKTDPLVLDSHSDSVSPNLGSEFKAGPNSKGNAVPPEIEDLIAALSEVTLCDAKVNRRKLVNRARKLHGASYTGQDVRRWYGGYWQVIDYRGKPVSAGGKGSRPDLDQVMLLIGHVRTLPPASNQTAAPAQAAATPDQGSDVNAAPGQAEEENNPAFEALRSMGVGSEAARKLAQDCTGDQITDAIHYVRARADIHDPAAYLVKKLTGENNGQPLVVPPEVVVLSGAVPPEPGAGPRAIVAIDSPSTALDAGDPEFLFLVHSVSMATGALVNSVPALLGDCRRLYADGIRGEDVAYFLDAIWPKIWPGSQGEMLTLEALMKHIGHAHHLLTMATDRSPGMEMLRRLDMLRDHVSGNRILAGPDDLLPAYQANAGYSPYLADSRFRAQAEARLEEAEADRETVQADCCPACGRAYERCRCTQKAAIPGQAKDAWLVAIGHFEVCLNRSTYDTWLRRVELVNVIAGAAGDTFVLRVPHHYAKEWIERNCLSSLEKYLGEWMHKPVQVEVEIEEPFEGTFLHFLR